jgi:dephospho-CoA kinase
LPTEVGRLRPPTVIPVINVFHNKPIIGITGGIGSGKSTIAGMFGEIGCLVISSDQQVQQAYHDPAVISQLRKWWGDGVLQADVQLNKRKISDIVFSDPQQRKRLEELLHPRVAQLRDKQMEEAGRGEQVKAIIWDTPLLFEAGLQKGCDAVVFVDVPLAQRLERVTRDRGWDEAELRRREKSQWPLDKKKEISDYIVDNTADADFVRGQVREVLFRILAKRFPDQT